MRITLMLTLALSLLLSAGVAQAEVTLEANIPFDFQVGKQVMPAGEYTISADVTSGLVHVRARAGGEQALMGSNAAGGGSQAEESKLVFNRYQDRYFLAQLWSADSNYGRAIPQSRRERELAEVVTPQPVTILLAAF